MDESHPDWAPSLHLGHAEVKAADNERLQMTLHEEELSPTREENEQQLEDVCKTQVVLHIEDTQQLIGRQEDCPLQPQGEQKPIKEEEEEPQPSFVKVEEDKLSITQEEECLLGPEEADLSRLQLTGVSVKTEDDEDKQPESCQLHHSPSEEKREAEPSSSSSAQHMTTEADGDHCGGSQADNLLAPLSDSDDTTSHSPEDEDRDYNQESLSSDTDCEDDMTTHTDNKHSECSKKKTEKKTFTCSVCDNSFSCKNDLTRHMRTHTGDKPFTCSKCSFSVRHSHCHALLMAKAKKLSLFERSRIVELHKQGLSQRAIAAEVGRSKTVIQNFLKDPEHYGTKKSSGRPKKITPALSRRIRLAVHQDIGWSSSQIKALTGADCSAITIRRHLREKGLKNKK
ncbi:zinc finger and SCAN domain-containing protein 2-like [Dunckerocampus dactyliophorus]|uniref:zinc finger and SCAN domain-containing protein 2-like n=1 Tax=Dunckerocampus dactyliophorus TaxID=161453 RepID=UPI0024058C29|nr:zinc finger and SCAN domain-containing protein 2-like [Dunckerocampus dactyliophorus]